MYTPSLPFLPPLPPLPPSLSLGSPSIAKAALLHDAQSPFPFLPPSLAPSFPTCIAKAVCVNGAGSPSPRITWETRWRPPAREDARPRGKEGGGGKKELWDAWWRGSIMGRGAWELCSSNDVEEVCRATNVLGRRRSPEAETGGPGPQRATGSALRGVRVGRKERRWEAGESLELGRCWLCRTGRAVGG